ncbi:hybrid sensor histidine kinase/response regulator [Sphingobium yanoikuyae]|uniref:hybrid sensor histidine kinase/response regulator n=1 Tax=Sphingobium yanoikuyae TaxID=13690 RepID=UPI00242FA8CC|nr:ATP-binding protein [Sphingobium yanoikuyae]
MKRQGYDAHICQRLTDVAGRLDEHVGVILLTEEALATDLAPLSEALLAQPTWSDIPLVLLAGRQAGIARSGDTIRRRLPDRVNNVVLLERPLSSESLVSAIDSAMRARQKQFEIRDRILELDAQHAQMRVLLEHLPVGVAFVDTDHKTLVSNPAFRRFTPTGAVPSQLPDGEERWIGYDHTGDRIKRDQFVTVRALRGETVEGSEFLFHPLQGDDVWTRVSGVPLKGPDGAVTGSISVIVDIDAQKRAQLELAEAAQKLEREVQARTQDLQNALDRLQAEAAERERAENALRQSQKMEAVGQLTGGIAHDFNNMLTGVIGALDIMKRRMASGRLDDLDRFMDAASTSAQRAAGLTARLLAFSRRQSLDSKATDVNALVLSLEDLLRRTMGENIEVAIATVEGLPPSLVDANQLENAILNLAINARDAMPDGGRLTIESGVATVDESYAATRADLEVGKYVTVAVSDTGVGMDAATIEKVFEPFFTTKPVGQGTGLGLSMVYGFAKQSNGQVRIHSTPELGTSITLYLPIADPTSAADETGGIDTVFEGDGQTVLLVEEDPSVRLLIGEVLRELGYKIAEAAEPSEAIRLLETGRPFDLMITDVGLPGMNGRQLAEVARAHLPFLPILFVTGYAENAAMRAGFLGTNMAMITKPFQIEILSAKIREMLN